MYTTILDTNILRSLSNEQFAQINECEIKLGVRQFADPWTLRELIAHLHSIEDPAYYPCRSALRRCVERSLNPLTEIPRVIESAELRISRAVFGEAVSWLKEDFTALIKLSHSIAFSENTNDLNLLDADIKLIAQNVEKQEKLFAQDLENLRHQVFEAAESFTVRERNREVFSFTRSPDTLELDAKYLVNRAYHQANKQPPDPIPSDIIRRILPISQNWSLAVGILLEKIICENANLEKSRIRNLLWDQEVAGNIGQIIDGFPVILVTQDTYFAKVAELIGNKSAVCTKEEYLIRLGISV